MARWAKMALGLIAMLFLTSPAWAQPDAMAERLVAFNGTVLTAILAIVLVALILVLLTLVLVLIAVWKDCCRRRTEK